jgi:hypothetical protein
MPEINIPFDLPFEYCKYCKELNPGSSKYYVGPVCVEITRFCKNQNHCVEIERAREKFESNKK